MPNKINNADDEYTTILSNTKKIRELLKQAFQRSNIKGYLFEKKDIGCKKVATYGRQRDNITISYFDQNRSRSLEYF